MIDISIMYGDAVKMTQLHYVRTAVDLGSFSRAAEALGVSQPALSHGIATLERTLGGQLFHRSTTGVTPTALAVRILPHLRSLLANLENLVSEARASAGIAAQPLRMGVSPLIHPALIARAFQAARLNPPAALTLKEDDLANLRADLRGRQLDLILVPSIPTTESYGHRHIDTEPVHYLPVAPASEPFNDEPIELSELSHQPLVMVGDACGLTAFTRTLFTSNGAELVPYPGQADSYRSLEDWARLGLGGALMPRSRFQNHLPTRPLHHENRPVTISYEALWLADSARTAAIDTLLDAITAPGDGNHP
jgi:DNA-binding transcriptional LysR family regulator